MRPSPPRHQGAPPPAVAARALVLAYGRAIALAASDVTVPRGAVTNLIGPNGSGKSTLLHALVGLIAPRSGTLEVLGEPPGRGYRRVAYVFQATRVNDAIPVTVKEVVTMGRYALSGAFGRLGGRDREAVESAMERLGIADLRHRHLRDLSGGQRQRVFVAQGLAQEAELLLLDEPLTGLDLVSHERIDAVVEAERRRGNTVVLTTHDVDEARRGDHVVLLAGRVVAEGPPEEVLTGARLAEAYGGHLIHFEEVPAVLDDAHHGTPG